MIDIGCSDPCSTRHLQMAPSAVSSPQGKPAEELIAGGAYQPSPWKFKTLRSVRVLEQRFTA